MVRLSVYRPPTPIVDDVPGILSFSRAADRLCGSHGKAVVARARLERANSQCPSCRRVTVDPIERPDAVVNRNGATIPGTATIVGFHCHACRHQWRVPESA